MTNNTSGHEQHLRLLIDRLDENMSVDQLLDWHAQVESYLLRDTTLTPFVNRLQNIINGDQDLKDKIMSAQGVLVRVLENASVPLSSTPAASTVAPNNPIPGVLINVTGSVQTQTQHQEIIQPINPSWSEIEEEIDSDEDLSDEEKNEAKAYARTILDGAVNGAKNGVALITAMQALQQLTSHAPSILKIIGVGV